MARYDILAFTWHHALLRIKEGKAIDGTWLQGKDAYLRALQVDFPIEAAQARLVEREGIQESPPLEPWEEISVELTHTGELFRTLPHTLEAQVEERGAAIRALIRDAVRDNPESMQNITVIFRKWMTKGTIVRVIGAGRALLAASIPANRLAHGGATVSLVGDKAPLPNSWRGGGLIAASASGEARPVTEDMERAKKINPPQENLWVNFGSGRAPSA